MIEVKDLQKSYKTGTAKAIENQKFETILDYSAPKGVVQHGTVQFIIKGTLINKKKYLYQNKIKCQYLFHSR